ncbi:MAG TPA: SprT family zinc-dependent metalloprotease [Allosphingosinicella sp.]|jgi:predicted metal-dependent hydrolase|nr:SprT family zinc-dependent metalloprotease [Allosphingosinicella sp.]
MTLAIWPIISSTASSDHLIGETRVRLKVSPRARRMRLSVDPRTRSVLLTVPRRVSRRRALAWASGHRAWIEAALAVIPPALAFAPGASVPLRGEPHVIDWDPERLRRIERAEGRLVAGGPLDGLERRILRWLKAEAFALLGRETAEFAARAGVTVARIGIGDPVSRWGSCSSTGAIRYSWRLILAPDFVRRATVAHEVAHRVHLNHGPEFHAFLADLLGADPRPARAWLKREGAALHRIGPR